MGREGKGREEEDPLDLLPPEKFPSYASEYYRPNAELGCQILSCG